jgi:hypothetical protein
LDYRIGAMIDLNRAPDRTGSIWPIIQDVCAINDRGQIVGNAYVKNAYGLVHVRACLLTPIVSVKQRASATRQYAPGEERLVPITTTIAR